MLQAGSNSSINAQVGDYSCLGQGKKEVVLDVRRNFCTSVASEDHAAEPPSRILCVPFALFAVEGAAPASTEIIIVKVLSN